MALVNYKCPNCGGGLKFDPATQSFECEYCLSSFTEQEMEELAKKAEEKAGASPAVVCTCPNCGARAGGGGDDGNCGLRVITATARSLFQAGFPGIPAGLCDPLCAGPEAGAGNFFRPDREEEIPSAGLFFGKPDREIYRRLFPVSDV